MPVGLLWVGTLRVMWLSPLVRTGCAAWGVPPYSV